MIDDQKPPLAIAEADLHNVSREQYCFKRRHQATRIALC